MARFSWSIMCLQCVAVLCSLQEEKRSVQDFKLRIPAIINKPFLYAEKEMNGSVVFKGLGIQIADYMMNSLNITYTLVPVNTSLIQQRGFNQILIDMLVNNDINIIMAPVIPTMARKAVMDFTYPLSFDAYKIANPVPQEASRLLAPLRPYQKMVWISLIASLLGTTMILGVISWFWIARHVSQQNSTGQHFGRMSIYVIAITLGQGDFLPYRGHSIRIAATGWCLMSVVLAYSYSSILTSYLTLPVYEKPINSLEDLVERPDIQVLIPADSALLQNFMEAQSGIYKAVGDSIRKRPGGLYKTIDEGLRMFFSGKYAYISAAFYIEYMLAGDYKEQKKCRFTVSKPLDLVIPVSYGLPRGGVYNSVINIQFIRMWESGILNHWLDTYRGRYEQCIIQPKSPRMTALKLMDLYTAFIILSLGIGLSFLALLYENVRCPSSTIWQRRRQSVLTN